MKVPLFKINQTQSDIKSITKILKSKTQWANGKECLKFEKQLSKKLKSKYAVVCNSGTSALHAAMIALEIGSGDEVLVPSFTFISTANAPLYVGAKPVFADIEKETFGIDPKDVLRKITDKTKAIIAVHYGGNPCKIEELRKIADDYGLFLVEDCAEAMGARVGLWGDISVWSFCQNKIITTGDGGALTTNSNNLYNNLKCIVNLGKVGNEFVSLGYNWRLSEIQCALGISQLKRLDYIINSRRSNAKYLSGKLGIPFLNNSVYQLFTIRKSEKEIFELKRRLPNYFISSKVYFDPVHLTPFYKGLGYTEGSLPVTERVSKQVITLPMYPDLTRQGMDYIANKVWKALSFGK
jgi:perosamine synthetase